MGIHDLMPHLPGGGRDEYYYSFFDLKMDGNAVPFDAASALWQFAAHHAYDYLRGNHTPALQEWACFLNYLRSVCGWKLIIYMDGMENLAKVPEIKRRRAAVELAQQRHDLHGQVKNTPEYIAKAMAVCQFLSIEAHVSAYEADTQVSFCTCKESLVAVTSDSDLLAYGVHHRLIVVKRFTGEMFCIINLDENVEEGEYPLLDLYRKHGRIVFQLYAAYRGCDFTSCSTGIKDVGYVEFLSLVENTGDKLTAETLSVVLWDRERGGGKLKC